MIGAVVVGLAGSFDLFPWIPEAAQKAISLGAFIIGIVSGKLASSPLVHSDPAMNLMPTPAAAREARSKAKK
jgi:hypothetical protein